ncbi:MAG: PPOX class F420-dependent oxidoreductase [Armatimonadota bacterium]|nr:PPOX class F420-dependent oxidoreductase [Armatimonadota bacterium]
MKLPGSIRAFLEKPNLAVLATVSPSGRPQATPVWFLLEGDRILINTSRGRAKLRNLQNNPYIAIVIYDCENPYQYVQIRGKVVAFDAVNGARDIDRLSMRYRGEPYRYPPTDKPENRVSILIQPTGFTSMGLSGKGENR